MNNKVCMSYRRGFTLTELAIVLGIVGIVLGSVWMAAGQVNEKSRITQAMNAYNAVAQNMTSLIQGGYGISNPPCATPPCNINTTMITSKVIPQWLGSGNTAMTPWNNTGFVMSWISGNPRTYRMSYYNVPRDACLGMIAQATNCTPGQPGCPIAIYTKGVQPAVNGYSAPAYTSTYGLNTAMSSTLADTACAANTYPGGGAAANSVEFDFTQ